jgi:ABC-type Fe3+-hydroxamate transport system substrate-binding protein
MFDLGLGEAVVGITDYCVHPTEQLTHLPRIGGTKNPNVDAILDLKPDLVLANWEENRRHSVESLEAYDVPVWVTFPKTVLQAMEVLWTMVGLFHNREAAVRLQTLELTLDWAVSAASERTAVRYFCPIWFEQTQDGHPWWMTFNRHTYAHDLMQLLGGENVFAERERRYPLKADLGLGPPEEPGERDTRYPRLSLSELQSAQPDIVLLPDEPFAFNESNRDFLRDNLQDSPAVEKDRIHLVDGSLITWYGTRLARALQELPNLLA